MNELIDRILASAPNPIRLNAEELATLKAYLATNRPKVSFQAAHFLATDGRAPLIRAGSAEAMQRQANAELYQNRKAQDDAAMHRYNTLKATLAFNESLNATTGSRLSVVVRTTPSQSTDAARSLIDAAYARCRKNDIQVERIIAEFKRLGDSIDARGSAVDPFTRFVKDMAGVNLQAGSLPGCQQDADFAFNLLIQAIEAGAFQHPGIRGGLMTHSNFDSALHEICEAMNRPADMRPVGATSAAMRTVADYLTAELSAAGPAEADPAVIRSRIAGLCEAIDAGRDLRRLANEAGELARLVRRIDFDERFIVTPGKPGETTFTRRTITAPETARRNGAIEELGEALSEIADGAKRPDATKRIRHLTTEVLGDDRPADETDAAAQSPDATQDTKVNLSGRGQEALQQYDAATEMLGIAKPTDREAYDCLVDHEKSNGQTFAHSFATWQRYLRIGRRQTGQQKNTPRHGRTGRSVIHDRDR